MIWSFHPSKIQVVWKLFCCNLSKIASMMYLDLHARGSEWAMQSRDEIMPQYVLLCESSALWNESAPQQDLIMLLFSAKNERIWNPRSTSGDQEKDNPPSNAGQPLHNAAPWVQASAVGDVLWRFSWYSGAFGGSSVLNVYKEMSKLNLTPPPEKDESNLPHRRDRLTIDLCMAFGKLGSRQLRDQIWGDKFAPWGSGIGWKLVHHKS